MKKNEEVHWSVRNLTISRKFAIRFFLLGIMANTLITPAWATQTSLSPDIKIQQTQHHKKKTLPSFNNVYNFKKFSLKDFFNSDSAKGSLKEINPRVLELALKAHQKASAMGVAQKQLLTIIDYSLPSTQKRLWVLDMLSNKVIYHTHVAHGKNSGDNIAQRFSDSPGSLQSSLGLFVTGKTYHGQHGLSLTLHGLEKGINGNAERRRIVVHAANYVNQNIIQQKGRLGRSWGCPAVEPKIAKPLIQTIKEGSLLFAYYPDDRWLKKSQFL